MENCNSDEAKNEDNEESPLIDKSKSKLWNFKVKNNFTKYLTVEPLICFYMLQIFVGSSTVPYHFHKACVALDLDTYFCDVITIDRNGVYQKCATFHNLDFYCKGLDKGIGNISCEDTIERYQENETKIYVKPEDYRFCKVIEKAVSKAGTQTDPLVDISAMTITFLVVMIVSIWSDKYSKRKICLMLPLLGELLISSINLYEALRTTLSFEINNIATIFIYSISGGMTLFLFGCFSYMNDKAIKRKLFFRFGVICLIMTIYRYIPLLYNTVYQYFHDDDSYITLTSINLVLNIICILYVKVILNESKQKVIVNTLDNGSKSMKGEVECICGGESSTSSKYCKMNQLAKAFSLDVIWNYVQIVFKKRSHSGRLVIILFLAIVLNAYGFTDNRPPCMYTIFILFLDGRFKLILNDRTTIDIIDIDAAIFVIISITMLVFKISDVFIAILVIGIPIAARLVMVLLAIFLFEFDDGGSATDFYTPFKRIAACSLLLAYVDKNESRIFIIVQAIAYLPKAVFQLVTKEDGANILSVFGLYDIAEVITLPIVFLLLPGLVFCGLGFLYKYARKYEKFKTELMLPNNTIETITENPYKSDDFEYRNGRDNHQLVDTPEPVSKCNGDSTDL